MHGAFLVPAIAAVLGTFFLARRLCNSPLLAALLLLFTPVFLVSATGVMCDVWLLALWVWSIECWMRALERNSAQLLFLASVLAAAAALTKYFGVALVPLLAVYTLVRERRVTHRILYFLIPILVIASYEVITKAKYGQGLFSNAMLVSWNENAKPEQHFFQQLFIGLSFAGGCLFSVLFYAPLLKLRRSSRETGSSRPRSGSPQRVRPEGRHWNSPNFRILIAGIGFSRSLFHCSISARREQLSPWASQLREHSLSPLELGFWHWLWSISSSTKRRILSCLAFGSSAHSFLRQ